MITKVWSVECGCYSSAYVSGLFTSAEEAQKYADYMNKDRHADSMDTCVVGELELYDTGDEAIAQPEALMAEGDRRRKEAQ